VSGSLLDYRGPRRVRAELAPWLSCRRCRLAETRRRVVLGRGVLPADVVLVGIGPGRHEDLIGASFVGPSGALLNKAIERAGGSGVRAYFANLVACHPTDRARGPNRDPRPDEVVACRELLALILSLARPRVVVTLGKLAASEARPLGVGTVAMSHPSYLVQSGGAGSVEFRAYVRELEDVFEGLRTGEEA
jgi:uracil-DNA glycosylase family 4